MSIDASAVARVLGITTTFKPQGAGNIQFLPQRIAVLAQGSTGMSYSSAKQQVTSAAQAGQLYGFGSPIHNIVRQLLPANGDGVNTIPVTIYPLSDAPSSSAASGTITPSGTPTKQVAYQILVNNIPSAQFSVPVGASVTQMLALAYTAMLATLELPVVPAFTYGTVTGAAGTNTGNGTISALSVASGGKPLAGSWKLTCNTAVANGGVFTLTDPNGVVISSSVTMTPGSGGTTALTVGGLQFTLTDGTNDFAVGDSFTITVPATNITATTKWKGQSANGVTIAITGDFTAGTTWAIVQPSGGTVNPSLTTALGLMGNVWETMVLNALDIADTTRLDELNTVGEGRWGSTVRKPFVAFTGCTATTVAAATTVSAARTSDRINAQLVSPGSSDLPFVVAARQLARIAALANNNPPCDYGKQQATGLVPGSDGVQWDYPTRDQAVKAGSSTVEISSGIVTIGDVVTFYAPQGEVPPAYRYVCDIVKLQNIIYNIALIFSTTSWVGAPLIPDGQATVNPAAKRPKDAKAAACAMLDSLADQAIISDATTAKKAMTAVIDAGNPKRLDLSIPVQLSGNTNIIDAGLAFSFFFGGLQAA